MRSTEKILLILIFVFLTNQLFAQTNSADAILGSWIMPDNEGIIEISKADSLYFGKIVWMKEKEEDGSPLLDKENPIDSLQTRTVEGLQVMKNFKYLGENTWGDGTFYAAKKGKIVEPEFVLIDENHLNIKISILFFSINVELTRIDKSDFFKKNKITRGTNNENTN